MAVYGDTNSALFDGPSTPRRDRNGNLINTVDLANRIVTVTGKGGKIRKVPLHPCLAEAFAAVREHSTETILGKGGSMRNVNYRLRRLLVRAGVDGGNRPAHRFRKTASTSLYEEGVPTDTIDKVFGWSAQSIRARYYTRIPDTSLYDAILKLYASDPIERPPLETSTARIAA